jgi:hypothetical protein
MRFSTAAVVVVAAITVSATAFITPAAAEPPGAASGSVYQCPDGITIAPASLPDANGPQAWLDGRGAVARAYSGAVSGQIAVVADDVVVEVDYTIAPFRAKGVPVRDEALRGTVECSTSFVLEGEGVLDAEFAEFLRLEETELIGETVSVDVTVAYSVHLTPQQLAARL